MGNCTSGNTSKKGREQTKVSSAIEGCTYYTASQHKEYEQLGLTHRDVRSYLEMFLSLHPGREDNMVVVSQILFELDLVDGILTNKIFNVVGLGSSSSHRISFHEFLIFTWPYLSLDRHELNHFCFELLNKSGSGLLTSRELRKMIVLVHGDRYNECDEQLCDLIAVIDASEHCVLTPAQFHRCVDDYPVLTYPFFAVRDKMREVILGERYWKLRETQSIKVKRESEFTNIYDTARLGFSSRHSAILQTLDNQSDEEETDPDKQYEAAISKYDNASSYSSNIRHKSHSHTDKSHSHSHSHSRGRTRTKVVSAPAFTFDKVPTHSGATTPLSNGQTEKVPSTDAPTTVDGRSFSN